MFQHARTDGRTDTRTVTLYCQPHYLHNKRHLRHQHTMTEAHWQVNSKHLSDWQNTGTCMGGPNSGLSTALAFACEAGRRACCSLCRWACSFSRWLLSAALPLLHSTAHLPQIQNYKLARPAQHDGRPPGQSVETPVLFFSVCRPKFIKKISNWFNRKRQTQSA